MAENQLWTEIDKFTTPTSQVDAYINFNFNFK